MDKVVATALEAVADVPDGASHAVGGFGPSGVPSGVPNVPIQAPYGRGTGSLRVVSHTCGAMDTGLPVLRPAGRIARVTGSRIGAFEKFVRPYLPDVRSVHTVDAVRTPVGRSDGALTPVRPEDPAAAPRELLARAPRADPSRIEHVHQPWAGRGLPRRSPRPARGDSAPPVRRDRQESQETS
jgi:hypothetical protein